MAKWTENDIPDLSGKRALVTGAASGIGFEAARGLAQHGAEVLLVDRNEQAGAEALRRIRALRADAKVEFLPLDLSSQEKVREFAAKLTAEGRVLDILVNNAGIQPISERRTTGDGFELTFGIGHLGHFTLTAGLFPLLLKSPAPRVVTVSSLVHRLGTFDWDDLQMEHGYFAQRPYNQTKLANLLFARELQRRAAAKGLKLLSLAVHPGVSRTNIGNSRKALGSFHFIDNLISVVLGIVMSLFGQSAERGGWPTLYACTSSEVTPGGFYGPDGLGETRGVPAPAKIHEAGRDEASARKLWQVSEELTGARFDELDGE
ncbi:Short-chain dehydrogenase/reductase SDR [Sterolibacterium denitrificans]|uniref:Short-chain dehydrogenase/reductase SDR n=1 Tax=Sterolibacterium denitrificans TaxID=157592 RepID=A0A7Z7HPA8_9PROT|nr:oxidoreductase [Sterolibacterium denitrificans]SMB22438.1 Short-chain dehydrogenase/reductase SDR [Sterolibacterium denitrificans]